MGFSCFVCSFLEIPGLFVFNMFNLFLWWKSVTSWKYPKLFCIVHLFYKFYYVLLIQIKYFKMSESSFLNVSSFIMYLLTMTFIFKWGISKCIFFRYWYPNALNTRTSFISPTPNPPQTTTLWKAPWSSIFTSLITWLHFKLET